MPNNNSPKPVSNNDFPLPHNATHSVIWGAASCGNMTTEQIIIVGASSANAAMDIIPTEKETSETKENNE
jgi:hypothetical protein